MKRSIFFLFALLIIVMPQTGEAYLATKATSIRLNDQTLMFMLTYSFGHDELSYRMPIIATRNGDDRSDGLGYTISNGSLRTSGGETLAIVLSNAKVEDGMYVVPKGESREFTLLTFFTVPETAATSSDFSVGVESLPFMYNKDGTYRESQLNEGELVDYRTPAIDTDRKIGITQKIN